MFASILLNNSFFSLPYYVTAKGIKRFKIPKDLGILTYFVIFSSFL